MNRVFRFENEENERDLIPNGIKKEGVEDILLDMKKHTKCNTHVG